PTFGAQAETMVYGPKPWEVNPSQSVYFRNDISGKLVMNISNVQTSLGCTNAAITVQGSGLDTIVGVYYKGVKRSIKEFAVISQNNTTPQTANYELTLYFDTAELSGINLANVRVVATEAPFD